MTTENELPTVELNLPVQNGSNGFVKKKKSNTMKLIALVRSPSKTKSKTASKIQEMVLCIICVILFVGFVASMCGVVIMWFTDMYNNSVLSSLVLAQNTTALEWWTRPPLSPELRVHVFNYTNLEDYKSGKAKKLKVEDLGPYVYSETVEKVNITHYPNKTISFLERRSFKFMTDKSTGKQYDSVIVPNIPALSYYAANQYESLFQKIIVNSVLTTTSSKPFKNLNIHSFLWGYPDGLVDLGRQTGKTYDFEHFGMLATRNGTSKDLFTINSGIDDLRKLNLIENFQGQTKLNLWSTEECNRLDGTDGSQFPPYMMDKKHPLNVFIKAFCRKFPLVYDSEVNVFDGIPAWRYKAPLSVFAHPNENPENQCYCHLQSGSCPPTGLFNATKCFDDAPIMISFPHFLGGSTEVRNMVDGLNPVEADHLTYADVHPRLAFPIDGASRFQINIQIKKSDFFPDLEQYKSDQVLPVLWMEYRSGELSPELRFMVYHSTFSINAMELALCYGSLGSAIGCLMLLAGVCYYRKRIKGGDDNDDEDTDGNKKPITVILQSVGNTVENGNTRLDGIEIDRDNH